MIDYSKENPLELINKGSIDLLESSKSYRVDRYSWAYEAWQRQNQIHWLSSEVPLNEDLKDWHSNDILTEKERNLLTQIFRLFTQSDIEVADNYLMRYIPLFQPLEIKMMLTAFSNSETIHIDAYSYLLKTLGMDNSEFSAFRQYKEMVDKVDYMATFGIKTCSDVARTLAMFGSFTEGLLLYASFGMLLNFPRFNKMKGMGQIITWSIRDESCHVEHITKLYHEWNYQTNSVTPSVISDIIDICQTVVNLEDQFIDLAFELGEVQGMAPHDIKTYIRFIADLRLTQLKINPIYGNFELSALTGLVTQIKPHPLNWLLEMTNGVEHASFFETRATEYSKGATLGEWHGSSSAWSLFDNWKLKPKKEIENIEQSIVE